MQRCRRTMLTPRQYAGDTIHCLQQWLERGRDLEPDCGAKLGHKRRIPDELDRIAQTLFAPQHDRPAADVAAALPHRLSKVAAGGLRYRFGTPRVIEAPPSIELAQCQQRHAFMVT